MMDLFFFYAAGYSIEIWGMIFIEALWQAYYCLNLASIIAG